VPSSEDTVAPPPPGSPAVAARRLRAPRARGIARPRVDTLLDHSWDRRLTAVVAPLGSGKTTALAQFASRSEAPVAWYQADVSDTSHAVVLSHLALALRVALPGLEAPARPDGVAALASALDAWPGERAALVVDDVHTLRGTPGEEVVLELLDVLSPQLSLLVAGQAALGFDATRLRIDGDLLELGADVLRFRPWEAERLFREEYRLVVPPDHVARLTRRVEGWAAGLQLYRLAAEGRTAAERLALIDGVGSRSKLGREFLARHVLAGLDPELRTFLVDTCVLGTVTPELADQLLGRDDGEERLAAVADGRLLTTASEDGAVRYHEVIRSHLEVLLVERDGEDAARARHHRAAVLLEAAGYVADALRCYGRAGSWDAVSRLLGRSEAVDTDDTYRWLDTFPPAIVEEDAWLLLTRARVRRTAGELRNALADLDRATALAGPSGPLAAECRRERAGLVAWLDGRLPAPGGWQGRLRAALRHAEPDGAVPRSSPRPGDHLAAGVAALAAGCPAGAVAPLEAVLVHPDAPPVLAAAARLGLVVATALREGTVDAGLVDEAAESAERAGSEWLARLARAALALTPRRDGIAESGAVRARCTADGDPWGAALAVLFEAFGRLAQGLEAGHALDDAAARFHALHAPVLEALVAAARAADQHRLGGPDAARLAASAERLARATRSPGARALVQAALAEDGAARAAAEAATLACGLGLLRLVAAPALVEAATPAEATPDQAVHGEAGGATAPAPVPAPAPAPIPTAPREHVAGEPLEVRLACFGAFRLEVGGRPVNLRAVRPRARSALRLLALHGGAPVHREQLIEALWPGTALEPGLRKLQVALSSLRQVMPPASGLAIGRDGESYRLVVPPGGHIDVVAFADAAATARRAARHGDHAATLEAGWDVLAAHPDQLLVEEGPAEWAVAAREHHTAELVAVARLVAEAALAAGKPDLAAAAAERGLAVDRYADPLWRLLERAHDDAGDVAAAARAARGYAQVREELGLV